MSTSCAIGLALPDGTALAIRCHYDGYPAGVGAILKEAYLTQEKVLALISLGEISSLGRHLEPVPGKPHTLHKRQDDVTLAYCRDARQPLSAPVIFNSAADFLKNGHSSMYVYYLYLFNDGAWHLNAALEFTDFLP